MANMFTCHRGVAVVGGSDGSIGENVATRNCVLELS